MEVAPDPAPLLLAGEHELLATLLQVVGQTSRADGGRGLPDEVVQQPLVACVQPAADAGRGQHQPPDLLAAIGHRARADPRRPLPAGGDQPVPLATVHLDAHEPHPERARDRLRDGVELRPLVGRGLERRGDPYDVVAGLASATCAWC